MSFLRRREHDPHLVFDDEDDDWDAENPLLDISAPEDDERFEPVDDEFERADGERFQPVEDEGAVEDSRHERRSRGEARLRRSPGIAGAIGAVLAVGLIAVAAFSLLGGSSGSRTPSGRPKPRGGHTLDSANSAAAVSASVRAHSASPLRHVPRRRLKRGAKPGPAVVGRAALQGRGGLADGAAGAGMGTRPPSRSSQRAASVVDSGPSSFVSTQALSAPEDLDPPATPPCRCAAAEFGFER